MGQTLHDTLNSLRQRDFQTGEDKESVIEDTKSLITHHTQQYDDNNTLNSNINFDAW